MKKNLLLRSAALAMAMLLHHAHAADIKPIDVPAGDLTLALETLAKQSGAEFVYEVQQLKGLRTNGVHGDLTTENAVAKLLEGTKLTVTMHQSGAVLIASPEAISSGAADQPIGLRLVQSESQSMEPVKMAQSNAGSAAATAEKSSASDISSTDKIQEIIVSAQRREERLQNVPISISVLSGDELDKSSAEGITDALRRVPGVLTTVGVQGGGTLVNVRGVGASGPLFNGSSPIGYYLDSVPFGLVKTAIAPDANAYDMERVEVLRGPQGTLYGASALNGVVRVLTKDANLNRFELKARTSVSSTQDGAESYRGDVAVNMPIVEGKLAARAVLGYGNLGGWIDHPNGEGDDANDGTLRNMRLKVNAQPNDKLSLGFSAWLTRNDSGATSTGDVNGRNDSRVIEDLSTDYDIFGAKIGYEFERFALTSATSYIKYENAGHLDYFGLGTLLTGLDSKVFAQEITLNSTQNGPWRWSVGGFYRDSEDRLLQVIPPPILPAPIDYTDTSESSAVFGEIGRRFLDNKMELTVGLRYFQDDVTNKENVQGQALTNVPLYQAGDSFDATTPRVVLTWYPSSDLTLYGSYSQGFRSGFPQNANVPRDYPHLKPDKLTNYEIGAKGAMLNKRFFFDASLYYVDWSDVQQTLSVVFSGQRVTAPVNGESASGLGADLALTIQPADGLELGINFSWNDLGLDAPVLAQGLLLFDKGDRLNFSPKYVAGASASYAFPLGSGGFEGRLSASANYNSEQLVRSLAGTQANPSIRFASGNPLLVARTSFELISANQWGAMLFVDNINNETDGPPPTSAVDRWVPRLRPRTYGVQLDYHF